MFKNSKVISIQFDCNRADNSLLTRVDDSEIAPKFVDGVDSFSKIFHCDFFRIGVGTNLLEQGKTLTLFKEASVFLTQSNANIDDLDLETVFKVKKLMQLNENLQPVRSKNRPLQAHPPRSLCWN